MNPQVLAASPILGSAFFMLTGLGLASMLIPLRATAEGWNEITLGWIGTAYALGFTAGCIGVPVMVRRAGHVRVFAVIQTLLGASLLLHALVVEAWGWALFRIIAGFATAGSYMILESWLNEKSENATRGLILSVYMIISMGGVGLGQYIAPFGDPAGEALFMVGALLFGAALMPLAMTTAQSPRPLTAAKLDIPALWRRSPAALVGSFMAGVIFANWVYFGPVYGQQAGLSTLSVATLMASAMAGGMVFQYPLGRLSDRVDRRGVMALAGAVGCILSLGVALIGPTTPLVIFACTFLLGSVLFPSYSLPIAHANDTAQPEEFVQVSAALLVVYGIGNMAGPQLGGRLMDGFGRSGFFLALAIAFAAYGGYALWRLLRRPG